VNIRATVSEFWRAASPRERVALSAVVVVVLGAALYLFLWEPAIAARRSLDTALPRLRAQLEQMHWQRDEVLALRRKVGSAAVRGDLAGTLRVSAAQAQFSTAVERVEAAPGGKARMVAGPVPFQAWLAWAETLHRQLGIRVENCQVRALDQPGLVRVDASFSGGGGQ